MPPPCTACASGAAGPAEELPVTVTVTPRNPAATARHGFTLPTVRELPPVSRPGTFASTW
jgi:hypothetical protein